MVLTSRRVLLGLVLVLGPSLAVAQQGPGPGTAAHVICDSGCASEAGGGDASAANQVTGNASLSSIDGKLTSGIVVASHAVTNAGTFAVQVTSGTVTTVGAVTSITNALPSGSNVIGHVIVDSSGVVHVIIDSAAALAVTNTNLDVALSTRLKAADTLAGVTTVGAVTSITNPVTVAQPTGTNLHAVVDSGAITETNSGAVKTAVETAATAVHLEDTPAITGDAGVKMLFRRNDTLTSVQTSDDGDNAAGAVDSHGHLYMRLVGTDTAANTERMAAVTAGGILLTQSPGTRTGLPLQVCNAVRRTNCQPKGY